jgi:hypothetical protein
MSTQMAGFVVFINWQHSRLKHDNAWVPHAVIVIVLARWLGWVEKSASGAFRVGLDQCDLTA